MELSIYDRLALLSILPAQGSYTTLKLLRQLREELSFDENEHVTINLREEPDDKGGVNYRWDPDKLVDKDVEIGTVMHDLIADVLRGMDRDHTLTEAFVSLYERFVENGAK